LNNSVKAIGWLNRSEFSSSEAERHFGVNGLRGGAFNFVNERCADHLRLRKVNRLATLEKANRRECLRASGAVCLGLSGAGT
jgi:hypothetical protein